MTVTSSKSRVKTRNSRNVDPSDVPSWFGPLILDAKKEADKILERKRQENLYVSYRADPVGFCQDVLGEHITDDVQHVMTSVLENPVTIARSANSVGKSFGAARIAVWWYKVFKDSQVYLIAAPPIDNLKRILWGQVVAVVDKHPDMFKTDLIATDGIYKPSVNVKLKSQSFITPVAIPMTGNEQERKAKFSGKHAPYLLFIVDEGDGVPDEVYEGIEGCLSGGILARLLIMFNPRAPMGLVYDMEARQRAKIVHLSSLNHPNVLTNSNVIPGAVTRDAVVRRINEWTTEYPPGLTIPKGVDTFNVPDFLVGATGQAPDGRIYPPLEPGIRRVVESAFFYMVLGEYPPRGESQLISREWIDLARSRWDEFVTKRGGEVPPEGVKPVLGIDIAEMGGDWNIACLRYGGFVPRLLAWQGMDSDQSTDKALELSVKHNVDITMVDGMGVGSAVAPALVRRGRQQFPGKDIRAVSVKVSEKPSGFIKTELGEFKILRDQLWWAVREWLRTDNTAMLPPDRMLIEELLMPKYLIPSDGRIRITQKETMRDVLRRSPDRADALCLTFYPVRRATVTTVNLSESYRGQYG